MLGTIPNPISCLRAALDRTGRTPDQTSAAEVCERELLSVGCAAVVALVTLCPATSPAQNLFVSNLGSGSVWEFDLSGNLITPAFASGLNSPQGIAFDKSGDLYVVYGGNSGTVAKYDPSGNLVNASFISGLPLCSSLAIDSNGNFYVANIGYGLIAKYGPSGNLINASFASGIYPNLHNCWGMAFDRNDNLYVADGRNNSITKINPNGNVNASFITGLSYPTGLTFDRNGNLYVADYISGKVLEYDANGTLINPAFVSSWTYNFESMAFDSSGNLYIGNNGNGVISKYGPTGTLINQYFASGGSGAVSIAFSPVPEPSAWAFFGLGLLALFTRAAHGTGGRTKGTFVRH